MINENIDIFLNYNYFGILSRRHKLVTIDVSDEIIAEKKFTHKKIYSYITNLYVSMFLNHLPNKKILLKLYILIYIYVYIYLHISNINQSKDFFKRKLLFKYIHMNIEISYTSIISILLN